MNQLKRYIIDYYLFKISFQIWVSLYQYNCRQNKVVGKILRVMLRRPRWETLVSTLEAMQGTNDAFTPDELYTHLR
jgi:pyrroloquinoline quinone (PQQ) biosynthesis protein C